MDYLDIYAKLMVKAKSEGREKKNRYFKRQEGEVYYEAHHIIPRTKGGEGNEKTEWKTHENIVLLTFKEHYMAHKLLLKIFPNDLDIAKGFWVVCNSIHKKTSSWRDGDWKPSPRTYETLNEIYQRNCDCEDCGTTEEHRFGKKTTLCYACEWQRTKNDEEKHLKSIAKNKRASKKYHEKNKVLVGAAIGERHADAVFTEEQVKQIRVMRKYLGWGKHKITKTLGLPPERVSAVGGIIDGSNWKHIVV
jgi:hypothetical protein